MNVTLVLLIVLFAVLAVIGVPLALALGLSTFVSLALTTDMLLVVIAQKVQLGADSYLMMAVPLFILAANIMNYSGVTERIFRFARAIVGSMPGALGHANVVASVVFAGISGSAIADSASLGNIEIKSMEDQGYPTEYAAAITVSYHRSDFSAQHTVGHLRRHSQRLGRKTVYGRSGSRADHCPGAYGAEPYPVC